MVMTAFYRSTTTPQPMMLPDVVTYIWLGQAMFWLLPWGVDGEVRQMIRTGTVAYEMLRPLDLYTFWYSRVVAMRLAPTLLRLTPMLPMALLFFGMRLPASAASAGAWILSLMGALLLSSALSTLMTISLLWTISGDGIVRLLMTLMLMFSGMLVPLPLFPDWMQPLLNALPFRGLMDVPSRLYLGHLPAGEVFPLLFHQLGWTGVLVFAGRVMLGRGLRRLVVQGG
jgi:ABC-2 type transport system permease protein